MMFNRISYTILVLLLSACGGSNEPSSFTIGGTVSGLSGTVVLQNNAGDDLTITKDGDFTFTTKLNDTVTYAVTILTQPSNRTCSITNSNGTIDSANITNISVDCIDDVASTLNSTTPASNASDVPRNTIVTATFNENMLSTSIDNSSFTLMGNSTVSGTVSFNGANNVATFTPSNNLSIVTSYTATLTTKVMDLMGNPLTSNQSWNFTTEDNNWATAALIENDNAGNAVAPQIAFSANGNALAVWNQFDGTYSSIYTNHYIASTNTWAGATLIENGNAGDAHSPQIAFNASGNAIAVWSQYDSVNFNDNIYYNHYIASTDTWATAKLIENVNTGTVSFPQIAFDANGNAMATWYNDDVLTQSDIYTNRYTASTDTWSEPTLIENNNAGDAYAPKIAIDRNGNALVVWYQDDGYLTIKNIYANRYIASTDEWTGSTLIENDNEGDAIIPQIAIDAEGNALAVWRQHDGTRINIYTNHFY